MMKSILRNTVFFNEWTLNRVEKLWITLLLEKEFKKYILKKLLRWNFVSWLRKQEFISYHNTLNFNYNFFFKFVQLSTFWGCKDFSWKQIMEFALLLAWCLRLTTCYTQVSGTTSVGYVIPSLGFWCPQLSAYADVFEWLPAIRLTEREVYVYFQNSAHPTEQQSHCLRNTWRREIIKVNGWIFLTFCIWLSTGCERGRTLAMQWC